MHQDQPGQLDAYLDLGAEDIARLVLCLLVEEMLRDRLAAYRSAAKNPLALHLDSAMVGPCERYPSP